MSKGFIPQEIIDQITSRIDIVEIVNDYVPLKKKGRSYQGLCPFHNEKTPSFSVSPEKQIYHCFGCGAGGNVFGFLMQVEGLTFPEAVEKLALRAGIKIPAQELTAVEKREQQKRERLLKIINITAQFYQKILLESDLGKPALAYLQKRGITEETIKKFQLGYSLPTWDGLIKFFASRGVKEKELFELGLVLPRKNGSGFYDRFRGRLMFPIWNNSAQVVAFGGRVLDGEEEPKYLNSPDTPLFKKGQFLYAIHLAKAEIRNSDLALVVEGYMDVIACHQFGINNAVASLGTAFTQQQAKGLMRHTYQVAIAYDADMAGTKASLRGLDILTDLGCQVKVINLPAGLDPDEFLKKHGSDAFRAYIQKGQGLIEYKLEKALLDADVSSIEGRLKAIRNVLPDLLKIESAVARESSINIVAKRLGLAETVISSEIRTFGREKLKKSQNKDIKLEKRENNTNSHLGDYNKLELQLLKLLLEKNEFFPKVEDAGGRELFSSPIDRIYEKLEEAYKSKGKVNITDFELEESKFLAAVIMQDFEIPTSDNAVADYIKNLQLIRLNREYSDKQQQLIEAEKLGDAERLTELLSQIEIILQQKKLLAP